MKVLGIIGPSDSGKTTAVERLTAELSDRGRVATVKHLRTSPDVDTEGKDTARHRGAGAATTCGIEADGEWFATGDGASLPDVLDRLAPDHDYALVEGYSDSRLPKLLLGDHEAERSEVSDGASGEKRSASREVAEPIVLEAESGDALDVEAALDVIEELEPRETLESLVARAKEAEGTEYAGAIATFTGRVRQQDGPDDPPTEYLEFEKYDGVAAERLATIREELTACEGVHEVLLHHRTGVVEAGEDIVFVVVLAGHRAEAFETVEDGIDRLKEEVPLFKKEVTVEDEFWRHEK